MMEEYLNIGEQAALGRAYPSQMQIGTPTSIHGPLAGSPVFHKPDWNDFKMELAPKVKVVPTSWQIGQVMVHVSIGRVLITDKNAVTVNISPEELQAIAEAVRNSLNT